MIDNKISNGRKAALYFITSEGILFILFGVIFLAYQLLPLCMNGDAFDAVFAYTLENPLFILMGTVFLIIGIILLVIGSFIRKK